MTVKSIIKIISATLLTITPLWTIVETLRLPRMITIEVMKVITIFKSILKLPGEIALMKHRYIT